MLVKEHLITNTGGYVVHAIAEKKNENCKIRLGLLSGQSRNCAKVSQTKNEIYVHNNVLTDSFKDVRV